MKPKMILDGVRAVADAVLVHGDHQIIILRGDGAPQITLRLNSPIPKERKSGYVRLESHVEFGALWGALIGVCKEHGEWREAS